MHYVGVTFRGGTNPNFNNLEAWVTKNPYAQASLYGQCTWFAWGRFYELYRYDPSFRGNGWDCVDQLLATHPDKFERSTTPPKSHPMTRKQITNALNAAFPIFACQ